MLMTEDKALRAHTMAGDYRPLKDGRRYKSGGCFPAGTLVTVPGGECPIEQVNPGDMVMAFDDEGTLQPRRVLAVHDHAPQQVLVVHLWGGGLLRVTGNHWLLVDGNKFLRAEQLHADAALVDEEGYLLPVLAVESENIEPVYNLTVEQDHTFIADGIRVHNKGGGKAPPPPPPPPKPKPEAAAEQAKQQKTEPVKQADQRVQKAGQDERRRAAASTGRKGTVLTGGQGVAGAANTAGKTLLGQ